MTYEEIRAQLAENYGWTFAVIDDMSFDQIESAWTQGKKEKGIPINSDEDLVRVRRNWRKYLGI